MEKKIQVGSNAFFKEFADFTPDDEDYVILVDEPKDFKTMMQVRLTKKKKCLFYFKRMLKQEFIVFALKDIPMGIGKFLVPEFAKEIDLTIKDLKLLQILIDNIDKKHLYEKIIYDAYLENNEFSLTNELLQKAYELYKNNKELSYE